jgi:hypothetical protein
MERAPTPTTNLIDLTDLEVITNEDHPMTMENDLPTSSGQINTQPDLPVEPTRKGKEVRSTTFSIPTTKSTQIVNTKEPHTEEITEHEDAILARQIELVTARELLKARSQTT